MYLTLEGILSLIIVSIGGLFYLGPSLYKLGAAILLGLAFYMGLRRTRRISRDLPYESRRNILGYIEIHIGYGNIGLTRTRTSLIKKKLNVLRGVMRTLVLANEEGKNVVMLTWLIEPERLENFIGEGSFKVRRVFIFDYPINLINKLRYGSGSRRSYKYIIYPDRIEDLYFRRIKKEAGKYRSNY